jgi:hypothetical protein
MLTSPEDGLSVPTKAAINSGQNVRQGANPIPVRIMRTEAYTCT